jgi:hypothetical protein
VSSAAWGGLGFLPVLSYRVSIVFFFSHRRFRLVDNRHLLFAVTRLFTLWSRSLVGRAIQVYYLFNLEYPTPLFFNICNRLQGS